MSITFSHKSALELYCSPFILELLPYYRKTDNQLERKNYTPRRVALSRCSAPTKTEIRALEGDQAPGSDQVLGVDRALGIDQAFGPTGHSEVIGRPRLKRHSEAIEHSKASHLELDHFLVSAKTITHFLRLCLGHPSPRCCFHRKRSRLKHPAHLFHPKIQLISFRHPFDTRYLFIFHFPSTVWLTIATKEERSKTLLVT